MDRAKILIVDDELIMRESLARWFERDGHRVDLASSEEETLKKINENHFDIILLDIKDDGMDALKRVKENDPDVTVIMMTAHGSITSAVEAMKNGAYDYMVKPFDPYTIGLLIEKILENKKQSIENLYLRDLKDTFNDRSRFERMLGQSTAMQEVFALIKDVAPTSSHVLITGETGTGKGLAAKAVHSNSSYCEGPFVVVNCGAIPEHLMESELFGYRKGAFTDAKTNKMGRLELAHKGTLFLDEIGEISMRMQIDLLRVLEDRVFYRVGGTKPVRVDFRLIAATNKELKETIKEGTFREDLYYRLNVISFKMPPLRDRREDIPILAEYFLHRFSKEIAKPVNGIVREAIDEMILYEWPGNVRELENAIERAVVVARGHKITVEDLPILGPEQPASADDSLQEMERAHIKRILCENNWNIAKSAKILSIDRSTLYHKIRRYEITRAL
ncbi:MAG: sigma-54-dependent Fis family transcriptional regulator [Deltaproteobacteria bacterium]|nr:sigma-54-dependent Fis family transcriptional regulator [Deltaproteobacteria bacterium]